ncbi:MAG: transglutaminase-like domain-containing protein [Patescibacteria group bacterium]
MRFKRYKIIFYLIISALFFGADFGWILPGAIPSAAASSLDGRILLQVQDKGQAWYVNPLDSRRYYLGRPDDAFKLMRSLGLGVSNADLASFKGIAPRRLAGRILLQVQDKGQAYYVNPLDLKLHYLGRPIDAFNLMRAQGLGITNADLARITAANPAAAAIAPTVTTGVARSFTFKYQNNSYQIIQGLSAAWYESYKTAPKVYTYSSANEPPNLREAFYGLFLQAKSGDNSLNELAVKLKAIAANNNWTGDQLAEFTLAFIQSIPYDHAKLATSDNRNTNPYYPYETLYLNSGVCSDKTFLAVALLRRLGYGAAILDFPEANHSAVGVACPVADSVNNSGYCYGETTNYFPLGVVPQSISAGQAQSTSDEFSNLFSAASLGKMEVYQQTSGQSYQGLAATRAKVAALKAAKDDLSVRQAAIETLEADLRAQETSLSAMKAQLENYYDSGQVSQYNNLVPAYNEAVKKYNVDLIDYQAEIAEYNRLASDFNAATQLFYQK